MDHATFDALTRSSVTGAGSRRGVLRLLAGSALAVVAARLGWSEEADAKAKKHKKPKQHKAKTKQHQTLPTAENRPGLFQAEGKRKKKRKKKPQPPPLPPLPPGCENCGTCQMCQDGVCVGDPDLYLVRCLDSPDDPGGQCHICAVDGSGVCEPVHDGNPCIDGDECSWCQDGQCVPVPEKDLGPCGQGPCHLCDQGKCVPAGNGTECLDSIGAGFCCNHACIHPSCPRDLYNPLTCECECAAGEQLCADGRCIPENQCCLTCGPFEKCCQGRCLPCPSGGTCGDEGCGCSGDSSVSCPPNPERPHGYCCSAHHGNAPFVSCTVRQCTTCPETWGCAYVG